MAHNEITLTRAVDGFLLHKAAEGRSPHTLAAYRVDLRKAVDYLGGDRPIGKITTGDLRGLFAYLHSGFTTLPAGVAPRPEQALSPKTIRNIHGTLSSFYSWAQAEGLVDANPMQGLARPKSSAPPIEPLTQADVASLLRAVAESRPWRSRPATRHTRATAARDRAIILVLLDTGLRASELCGLTVGDLDQRTGHIVIRKGKGGKGRVVVASRGTVKALWRYLVERPTDLDPRAPLFAITQSDTERPMTRDTLGLMLSRAGQRAGVQGVHPHRFRHTFAVEFLRNGGNIYTLQSLLGHSTLEMVKRYLALVQADLDSQHSTASPVTNWRL